MSIVSSCPGFDDPVELGVLMSEPDPARVGRVVAAMMPMVRLDIGKLRAAADGE